MSRFYFCHHRFCLPVVGRLFIAGKDWHCEGSGQKVEDLFTTLQNIGFSREDVIHLENLSDKRVLGRLSNGRPRYLQRNRLEDVTLYMNTLAEILEEDLGG